MHFDIREIVKTYGIKNVKVFAPIQEAEMIVPFIGVAFTSSNSPSRMVLCDIINDSVDLSDTNKIRYSPINREISAGILCDENQYISDFNSIARSGYINIYLSTGDGYELLYANISDVTSEENNKITEWFQNISYQVQAQFSFMK